MINSIKNKDTVKINMFGKEKDVKVLCTGDNKFDDNGYYKKDGFELTQEELNLLNWFLENVKIEDYKEQIKDYCNMSYEMWSDTTIALDDVENEINITSIAINVTKKKYDNYPDISFYGDCKCDPEHGICIGFRNKKFLGIESQDWTL